MKVTSRVTCSTTLPFSLLRLEVAGMTSIAGSAQLGSESFEVARSLGATRLEGELRCGGRALVEVSEAAPQLGRGEGVERGIATALLPSRRVRLSS
jgi:hypothetical protein